MMTVKSKCAVLIGAASALPCTLVLLLRIPYQGPAELLRQKITSRPMLDLTVLATAQVAQVLPVATYAEVADAC